MRRITLTTAASVAVAITLAGCGAATSAPAGSPVPSATASADTTLVADLDVGGRTMHIVCVGPTDTGRPTIIFENGLGGDFGQWADVLTGISATDRGCSYDRAGINESQPAPTPRTTADQVDDLRALLAAADVKPPYILVGYSLGGWNVLVHADRHPDDVVGAVLVEVRPPDGSKRWLAALPPESADESDAIHQNREEFTTFDTDPTLNPEGLDLRASSQQASPARLGDDPLVVLVAKHAITEFWGGLEPDLQATMDGISTELQNDLVARSTNGRLEMVEDATHELPAERPDAVIKAIQEVLSSASGG
jgi:pimeloyl-ACP methyl ester carboxylesterase